MAFNGDLHLLKPGRLWQLIAIISLLLFCGSCKKAIEQQQRNIIIDAMTNGRWYVEQYKQNTVDVTGEFMGYEFQFYENGGVDGIKNSSSTSGSWSTDISNYTITASFGSAANDTLKRLNYTWKITDSYLDYVEAKTTTSTGENILHLRKK
ncbi:MAG TPA: hypothetical protein VL307_15670 [Chitinophagaceae bacterium]|nr:hypothetical protein [Chitinophagaceae bacterium]